MKKIISLALSLIMILSLVQLPVLANENEVVITSPAEWEEFIEPYNHGDRLPMDKTVYLECDLTIEAGQKSSLIFTHTGKLIGRKNGVEGAPATIYFGYTGYPFINVIEGEAEVANLVFEPVPGSEGTLVTTTSGGVLAVSVGKNGSANTGVAKITNVVNNIDLSGENKYKAGLVGYLREASVIFTDCVNNGDITTTHTDTTGYYGGGIISYNYNDIANSMKFINCVNNGNISAPGHSGGIVGGITYTTEIIRCTNNGDVTSTEKNAGGIIGCSAKTTLMIDTKISECYNTGDITGHECGGISGQMNSSGYVGSFAIENCYNTGNVTAGNNAEGIVTKLGLATSTNQKINNCYNIGYISGVTTSWGICTSLLPEGSEYNNNYSLWSQCNTTKNHSYKYSGTNMLANTEPGFEKVNDLGSAYVSLQGSYPVLRNNLPEGTYHTVNLVNDSDKGTVSKDAETLVRDGDVYTVVITPNEGYTVAENEYLTLGENGYATLAVTDDMEIEIEYVEEETYSPEGITGASSIFPVTEDVDYGFNLIGFARYNVGTEAAATKYGIELWNADKTVMIVDGDASAKEGANAAGEFGVRFYGAGLNSANTYYLRPYVVYGNGAPVYADYIEYTPAE